MSSTELSASSFLQSLITGALFEAACAVIAGFVGHFLLAPSGTPLDQLTPKNKQGGDVLIAFAVLHVFMYAIFWGPTPWSASLLPRVLNEGTDRTFNAGCTSEKASPCE